MLFTAAFVLRGDVLARLVNDAYGVLLILAVFALGRRAFTRQTGVWAAALFMTMPLTATWPFTRTSICSFTPSVTPSTLASALPVRTTWIESVVASGESLAPDGGRVPPIELWIRRRTTAEISRRRARRERADRSAVRSIPLAGTCGSKRSWDSVTTFAAAPAAS